MLPRNSSSCAQTGVSAVGDKGFINILHGQQVIQVTFQVLKVPFEIT